MLHVPHYAEVMGDVPCVMVEFSQSTAAVVDSMKDKAANMDAMKKSTAA